MPKSLNKVQLIGNLTRDPELRYTPNGAAVCSFGVATNRSWTTDTGEKKEEVEFHNIVAWRKLAEICSQYLTKGQKVYLEGRLATRSWTGQDGQQKSRTEVIIDDMIMLSNKGTGAPSQGAHQPAPAQQPTDDQKAKKPVAKKQEQEEAAAPESVANQEEVAPDDIPF